MSIPGGWLIALCLNERRSAEVTRWYRYSACNDELVSAMGCVIEFASALGIKQRTGKITTEHGRIAWQTFEQLQLCTNDLQLLPVTTGTFRLAATLILEIATTLRAGDALPISLLRWNRSLKAWQRWMMCWQKMLVERS